MEIECGEGGVGNSGLEALQPLRRRPCRGGRVLGAQFEGYASKPVLVIVDMGAVEGDCVLGFNVVHVCDGRRAGVLHRPTGEGPDVGRGGDAQFDFVGVANDEAT